MSPKMKSLKDEFDRLRIFAAHDRKMVKILLKKDFYKILSSLSPSFAAGFEKNIKEYSKRLDRPHVSSVKGVKFFHRVRDLESIILDTKDYMMIGEFVPRSGDVVIDAGAGVGEYTVVSSVEVGKSGSVIAIEASSEPLRYLSKNAKLNPNKNIRVVHAALGEKSGRVRMFRPAGTSFVDSINKNWKGLTVSYYVKSVTVDGLVKKFGLDKLDLLKLDIEGAELLALRGSMKTIARMKPRIIIETHGRELHGDVIKFLKMSGYRIDLERIKFEEPFIAMVYASSRS